MNKPHHDQPVFCFHDVAKRYPMGQTVVHALRDVNMEVREGEYLAVLGPSGSGKSTLMHIMGFMDQPTDGRVVFEGRDVGRASPRRRAMLRRTKVGFVFQAFNLLPKLSVVDNVLVPLIYQNIGRRESVRRARRVLEMVGLEDRLGHMPGQLSGGQRQRVAIARALVNQPRIILADEPTGNLDSQSAAMVLELFDRLHEDGATLVLVTHDEGVARQARRRVVVRDGRVTEDSDQPEAATGNEPVGAAASEGRASA